MSYTVQGEHFEINEGFSNDEFHDDGWTKKGSNTTGNYDSKPGLTSSKTENGQVDGGKFTDKESENDPKVSIEQENNTKLLYNTSESPPIHLLLFFGLQQALMSLSMSLSLVLVAAMLVCADDDDDFKAEILSSTLFVNGISTLMMVTIGVRLPLYQGAYGAYLIPLLSLAAMQPDRCKVEVPANYSTINNGTDFDMAKAKKDLILGNFRELQGSLIAVGAIHCILGATGLIGVLLRFVGPVTIVPTILLLGIYVAEPILDFAVKDWPVTIFTCAVGFILAFYLSKYQMPIPIWTPSEGFRIIRYPLHQVYAILISIVLGWLLSLIITECGGFTDDPKDKGYLARTDARLDAITNAKWFYIPYPGLHGPVSFKPTIFIGFLIATVISVLDSIGDYYACAAMCRVPPPPRHAMNRGIMIEGVSTILSGALGCSQATTTYGGNIGAIGVTKVASRSVFVVVAIIYMIFGMVGKISAVFITIPYPVLGGANILLMGMFNGVILSNLQVVNMASSRNLAIIGTSILVGLMVPLWIQKFPNDINTGSADADFIIKGLLSNPNFIGGVLACFLDNTVPGSREDRGITAWSIKEDTDISLNKSYEEGLEVYRIWMPKFMKTWRIWKYLPFMPNPKNEKYQVN